MKVKRLFISMLSNPDSANAMYLFHFKVFYHRSNLIGTLWSNSNAEKTKIIFGREELFDFAYA